MQLTDSEKLISRTHLNTWINGGGRGAGTGQPV